MANQMSVYGNSTDLANARATMGNNYNYIDSSAKDYKAPTDYSNSIVVGGAGAIGGVANSGSAIRLSGANRADTQTAMQNYANKQPMPIYDPTEQINAMNESKKTAAIAGLGAAKDASLSNLAVDRAAIQPQYYKNREQTSTASQLGAKNFAEFYANRGQSGAGASMQSEINRNSQLQNNIGDLNVSEQGAFNTNTRDVTNTNNAYNSDVAQSNAGIDAQGMQQLIDARTNMESQKLAQANADRSYNYQTARDTVTDTGKTANGQYTQSGQLNALNLKEIQDPNSTTNQMAKLGLDTAKLNYAALPAQLKSAAQLIAMQLAQGAIDLKTAQTQLNYLPQSLQAGINAQNASTNASNIDSYGNSFNNGSGGGGNPIAYGGGVPVEYTEMINGAAKQYGIPPEILGGLLQVESGFNVNAHNNSSGADGMAQFLASTAREQGVDTNDAKSSIYGAAKYLAIRVKQAGSLNGGIMGYGEGTTAYLNKVLGATKAITAKNVAATKIQKAANDKAINARNAALKKASNTAAAQAQANKEDAYNKNNRSGILQ